MRRFVVAMLALLILAVPATARELEGVTMPDSITVDGNTLVLNGMGVRIKKVVFVKVKVYVGGLYLPKPNTDAAAIITADEPKQLVMHFLYKEVSRAKLVDAWTEGFEANAPQAMAALKKRLETFESWWTDMKKGDTAAMTYLPGTGTRLEINGKEAGVIPGKDFADALFAVWLGPKPPNKELKEGLLGE